ncbi:MAG: phosphoribosyltransferase family protein [Endozoicomonas sp. (ex Botrylloides leachii)]|nr:phosphoribosyltransferase family protein [Endozoicomonas sp. (ex Botrylloides leachii)]
MTGSSCPACGIAMPTSIVTQCAKCIQTPLSFDCCLSAFVFSYPVNHIIQRIKYNQGTELISPLIPFLTNVLIDYYCARPWPEAIIPTPLHKKRMRSRGYNQSLLLAKAIHQALPINSACHLEEKSIYKHKETASQQNLPASARRKNIKGAFCVKNTIPFRHVAIVDDVVTTSETVSEISRVLKKTGVEQVDIWCLARTPRDNLIG